MSYSIYVTGTISRRCEQKLKDLLEPIGGPIVIMPGGLIRLPEEPSAKVLKRVNSTLEQLGFSMIADNRASIVGRVKALLEDVIDRLQNKIKLSEYLSANVPYEYHYLSSLFSQVEGRSIESFFIGLKIEKIKELLRDGQLTISEIAHKCGYSSPAHLTNQFKRATGKTPSAYKAKISK